MVEIRRTDTVPQAAEAQVLAILSEAATAAGYPFRSEATSLQAWDGETFLGGLIARIGVDWVCVEMLAVDHAARGRGVGRALMAAVETLAREQGKTGIWLDSYTFQAPDFYRRLGYAEIGRIEHYPRDQARVFLAKRFEEVPLARRQRPREDHGPLLALVRTSFAFMDGRIDPPSSVHRLTAAAVTAQAEVGEVWVLEVDGGPVACLFATPMEGALYVGKLAVAGAWRGRGLARRLMGIAEDRARAQGFPRIRLQSRVELTENHAAFAKMGFANVGETAHEGYDRPTSITMEKPVAGLTAG